MNIGDKIKMEGPKGLLFYEGHGNFLMRRKPIVKRKIGLIAGGTGITPCFQIAQASTFGKDGIPIVLLYSNKTKGDILLKDDFESLVRANPDNLKVYHTLTREQQKDDDTYFHGRITEDMIRKCGFPEPSADTLIGYCGPAPFNKCVEDILQKMGYSKDMIYKF